MKQNEYPLDITLTCAMGLEGGLQKHSHLMPKLPANTLEFVHEWNRALLSTLRDSKYREKLGTMGKIITATKSPKLVAWAVDKVAVPYRSFYYANRFATAYNVMAHNLDNKGSRAVVDYGHGFSPLLPLLMQNKSVDGYGLDFPLTQEIFDKTSQSMGIAAPQFSDTKNYRNVALGHDDIKYQHGFVSLGTLAYLPMSHQYDVIQSANCWFDNMVIEVDGAPSRDANIVKKMGAKYNPYVWNADTLKTMIYDDNVKIKPLSQCINNDAVAWNKNSKLSNDIKSACELFIIKREK